MLDLIFSRRRMRTCDGVGRRDFLRVGGLTIAGLSLGQILQAEARAKENGTAGKTRAKNVILCFLGGGMSHHDTFDLKPQAAEEIRGKYKPIATNVPGTQIGEMLPLMARTMDKVCLVRSGAHNNDHHETATNWVLSGRFGTPFGDYPAVGAVVAHELGFQAVLPPYVAIPRNPSFTWELGKSAFLGGRFEAFKTGDPNDNGFTVRDVALREPMNAARLERRTNMLAAVDGLAEQVQGNDQLKTFDEFRRRAGGMLLSPEARSAFNVDLESPHLRDRYGRHTFGQSCLLARRLVERGVRFATVNFGGWDHHGKIFEGLGHRLPEFDQGFSALIDDLATRGLLNDTLVVAMGEFGRSPRINKDAGRDHWGPAASLLFAGGGVAGGRTVGATDKDGGYVVKNPVAPADVIWTILSSLGIDPNTELHTPDGRPLSILDQGRDLHELFA